MRYAGGHAIQVDDPDCPSGPERWSAPAAGGWSASDAGAVWPGCRRRLRRWPVPHPWSAGEWLEEMEAEASAAAVQAARDFDPGRGVPWFAFLRRRIMEAALARYRREWAYSCRREGGACHYLAMPAVPQGRGLRERECADLFRAIRQLSTEDLEVIERIYWRGESEHQLADDFGVSQQAVNKRKQAILRVIRGIMLALEKEHWRL